MILLNYTRSSRSLLDIASSIMKKHTSLYSFNEAISTTRIWLDELRCLGTESRLINCPANAIGIANCGHSQDVALICEATASKRVYQLICTIISRSAVAVALYPTNIMAAIGIARGNQLPRHMRNTCCIAMPSYIYAGVTIITYT